NVINTHAHYDHAGGLRTYVAQGVTVVTHEKNKPFYEKAWARPRTIAPDSLSKAPKAAVFETASDKKVMSGGGKTLELYYMKDTSHNMYNLFVYLPQHKLAFWGDGYNPPDGNEARDLARTPEQAIELVRTIMMNTLDEPTSASRTSVITPSSTQRAASSACVASSRCLSSAISILSGSSFFFCRSASPGHNRFGPLCG